MVKNAEDIRHTMDEVYPLMKFGRPGRVLLDLPLNIQRADVDISSLASYTEEPAELNPPTAAVNHNCNLLQTSARPVILAGGGVRSSHACEDLRRFRMKPGILSLRHSWD